MKVVITNIVMMKLVHLNKRFGHSVREVRDSLMKLERNLKHAIKLKNEQEWIQEHITNMLRIVFKDTRKINQDGKTNRRVKSVSTYKKMMAEAFGVVKEGKIEQRELKLFIDNDSRLYRQRFLPIMRNLSNKMSKDRYKASLAERAFMYLVNDGVKKYISDFGGDKDTFSKADLKALQKNMFKNLKMRTTMKSTILWGKIK